MFINKKWLACASVVALGIAAIDVRAQVAEVESVPTQFGLAIASVPDYKGSADNTGAIAPILRYTFSDGYRYVSWVGPQINLNLLSSSRFRLGPAAYFQSKRDDDVDNDVVARMNKLDSHVEGGVFAEMVFGDEANKRNRTTVGATFLTNGGRAHMLLKARWNHQVAPEWDINLGGGLDYGNSDYNNYYFGVNPGNVGTSGLPNYTAGSGVNEYYFSLGATWYINRDWMGVGMVKLGQITGDAKDSPLVDGPGGQGDKSQTSLAVGVIYQWR